MQLGGVTAHGIRAFLGDKKKNHQTPFCLLNNVVMNFLEQYFFIYCIIAFYLVSSHKFFRSNTIF